VTARGIEPDRENDCLLAWCDNGSVAACFMSSVLRAFSEDASRGQRGQTRRLVEYYSAPGPYIHDNRARIVRYFLQCTDKQWLWMLDNDIEFPSTSLYELLASAERHEVKILGAAYWNEYPHSACYLSWLVFTPRGIVAVPELPEDRLKPFEVTAVGMGCTLIHRDVLQDIADMYPNDPWDTFSADMLIRFSDGRFFIGRTPDDFEEQIARAEEQGLELLGEPQRMGEDVTLCLRARRAGYPAYGLPSLVVEHFKPHYVTPRGFGPGDVALFEANGGEVALGDEAALSAHKEE
jgi:hypothetical protein